MSATPVDRRSTIDCSHGWDCHGRKNGRCPYKHPTHPPVMAPAAQAVVAQAPVPAPAPVDRRSTIDCTHGLGCHGLKNGHCPYKHPAKVPVAKAPAPAPAPVDRRSTINCSHGWDCHGRKNGRCPYKHPTQLPVAIPVAAAAQDEYVIPDDVVAAEVLDSLRGISGDDTLVSELTAMVGTHKLEAAGQLLLDCGVSMDDAEATVAWLLGEEEDD